MKKIKFKDKNIPIILIILVIITIFAIGSYALLLWTSKDNTELTMRIGEVAEVVFAQSEDDNDATDGMTINGNQVTISNMGPVFDYEKDGEIVEFSIRNLLGYELLFSSKFHVNTISDNLKSESFKLAVLYSEDGKNYNKINDINFVNASNNSDLNLFTDLPIAFKGYFKVIFYLEGNSITDSQVQGGSLSGYISADAGKEIIVTDEVLLENLVSADQPYSWSSNTSGQTNLVLQPGEYLLQVWGAQGGSYNTTYVGGMGGYSYGTLTLTEETNIQAYVGGQAGAHSTTSGTSNAGGYNGGGAGYTYKSGSFLATTVYGLGGGGASDIRIASNSLNARVIVAGGGSGSNFSDGFLSDTGSNGYHGGGATSGGSETAMQATQTAAGTSGSFGTGASTSGSGGPGGGGGWYGGGVTGGGSGYVYTSSTASDCPDCKLNSSYYLKDAATIAGDQSFTDYDGTTVTGHSGNGAIKITGTVYATYNIPTVRKLTDLTIMKGQYVDLTKNIMTKCAEGTSDCIYMGPEITDTSTLEVGTHTIYYIIKDSEYNRYKYPRTITVTESFESNTAGMTSLTLGPGTYKLEVWGAEGGYAYTYTSYKGGNGGYSYGNLTLTENVIFLLILVVKVIQGLIQVQLKWVVLMVEELLDMSEVVLVEEPLI